MLYFAAMHANVQWRHNPATGEEAPYYRLKESYRDVCGTVHSLVVLNIGFEPALVPRQMRRIAAALTSRFAHRHQKDAFGGPLEGLDPAERDYAERYWRQMITDGQIDRFDNREEQARQQEGEVRPQQGEAQRLQAAGPRAVRQHRRLPALLRDTGGQHLGPEVATGDGQAAVGEGREIYWKLGYKEAPFRKMKICRSQRPPD